MNGLERIRRSIRFEPTDRPPVAPLLGAHAVRLIGASFDQACRDAGVQATALLHAVEAYQPDAVFTLMDLSAEPEALGAATGPSGDGAPVVVRHLSPEELDTNQLERRVLTARVPVFLETVSRLRRALGDAVCVGALMSGPLTAVSNAVGLHAVARMLRRDRGCVERLLDRLSAACIELQRHHAKAGAHAVVLLEPVATTAILGPPDLESLLLPRLRSITQAAGPLGLVSLLHVCGDCRGSLSLLARSGAHALSLDAAVDLPAAREVVGSSAALMGNLDVRRLLTHGNPAEVAQVAQNLVQRMGGGFILSSGCELPAGAPRENVRALTGAVRG